MDFSTINVEKLKTLPTYKESERHHLQVGSGNGCFGDPPGYPTYFTRNVYNSEGDPLPLGKPQMVITCENNHYVVDINGEWEKLLPLLWKPLPLNHNRTRLWIMDTYRHHNSCYNGFGEYLILFPVPKWCLKSYTHDSRWNEEYAAARKKEVDAHNANVLARNAILATSENHNAVRVIRKFYPEYMPEPELIELAPANVGMWWTTEAEQPSEADCAIVQRWGNKHPYGNSWCQFCGRYYPKA